MPLIAEKIALVAAMLLLAGEASAADTATDSPVKRSAVYVIRNEEVTIPAAQDQSTTQIELLHISSAEFDAKIKPFRGRIWLTDGAAVWTKPVKLPDHPTTAVL